MSDATRRLADELTDDELDTLVEMVQARNEGRLTRREVVKSGGLLAALGLGGGAAVGSASADASTSDSDGNIGEPGNRVDAFLDGADANSVSAGQGDIKQIGGGVHYTSQYADVQSAVDAIVNGEEVVFDEFEIEESVDLTNRTHLRGLTIASRLYFSGTDHTVDVTNNTGDHRISNIWVDQTGSHSGSYDAIHIDTTEVRLGPYLDIDDADRYGVYLTANAARTEITGLQIWGDIGDDGIQVDSGADRCMMSNVLIEAPSGNSIGSHALNLASSNNIISGIIARNAGSTGVNLGGTANGNTITGIKAYDNGVRDIGVGGDGNVLCGEAGSIQFFSGATENVFYGSYDSLLADDGTRTVINGNATNGGDPNSTGQWNGNAAVAHRLGATVWDTSTSPDTPYIAGPDGNWVAI